jgi:AcrR family transcriptional regulator
MAATGRTYRGQTAEARAADRRRRLIDAGLELFGTEGWAGTTIPALCAQAGVSPGHFYEAFDGREAVLRALYEEIVAETATGAATTLATDGTLEERVHAGLAAYVAPLLADPRKARVNFVEVIGVSAEMEAHRRDVLRGFAALIAETARQITGEAKGGLVAAMALVGATNEPLADWFVTAEADRPQMDEVLGELTRVYVAVLA